MLIHINLDIKREFHMAGRRYETFLQVLKNISRVSAVNTRTEISFLQAAINFLFIVIFTNEIPKQFTVIFFAPKGTIYFNVK